MYVKSNHFPFLLLASILVSIAAHGQSGPGGVGNSTSNILWLRAEEITGLVDGDTITTWVDASGNGNDVSQPTVALKPEYNTNVVNGLPVVNFNVANARLRRNPFNGFATSNITAIYVNRNNGESGDGILSYASAGSNNDFLYYGSQNIGFYRGTNRVTSVAVNDNNWHIVQGSWGSVGGNVELWKDGSRDYINTGFNSGTSITSGGSFCIAHEQDSPDGSYESAQDHIGEFTEVIVYNTYLDRADHVIVANYLAAKYDISLATNDIYVQDDNANGDFDFEVAGIGQYAAGVLNDDAQGTAIVRILNPTNLDNGEYMIWGHNGAPSQASNITDIPASVQARYERVWRLNETNVFGTAVDVGSVDMRWDLSTSWPASATDLRLLIDTDNDGLFSDETPISGATHLGGDIYEFAGVSGLANNLRFTLATINTTATPLPIELVSFDGRANDNYSNTVLWTTDSETNNDYFTIKKSSDGVMWQTIGKIKGAGNSSLQNSYSINDYDVMNEITYYQLSQTDFDGTTVVLKSISVQQQKVKPIELTLYPNPTTGVITISGRLVNKNIVVQNIYGQSIAYQLNETTGNSMQLDFSDQPNGIYVIKIDSESYKVVLSK